MAGGLFADLQRILLTWLQIAGLNYLQKFNFFQSNTFSGQLAKEDCTGRRVGIGYYFYSIYIY